jgi:hypothetical protein
MRLSLDQTTDYSFQELHSFLHGNQLPEFVKQAEVVTKEALSSLPTEAFADRYHRAFPIDSAPNVYVSNAYFMNKRAELEDLWGKNFVTEVEERLTKAAEILGIQEDTVRYNSSLMEKSASDYDEQYVASFDIGGCAYDLFPYKTAADLSKQAELFNNNIKNYPFGWRRTIAQNFIKQAEVLSIDELPDLVCKYGGLYFPDTRLFQAELERRMHKLSEKIQEKYKPIVEKAASCSSRDDSFAVCAEAYGIEKEAGVYDNNRVYQQLGDIVDKTFNLSLHKVADLLNVVNMAGDTYAIEDLKKISSDIYKQAFGVDLDPTKEAELKDVLPTMPLSDVALFRELSGVKAL